MHADALFWVQKKEEELPPWIRSERERKLQTEEGSDLPFPVYLIGSALVAIAAVGPSPATAPSHYCSKAFAASYMQQSALPEALRGLDTCL